MTLRKKIAVLTMVATVSLFANSLANVSSLVDQINKTTDVKERKVLIDKLNIELSIMDKSDAPKAKELIESKLKQ